MSSCAEPVGAEIPPSNARSRATSRLVAAAALLLIVWLAADHLRTVSRYAVDVPIADDYDAVLCFVNRWVEHSSLGEVAREAVRLHNEHRPLLPRCLFALQYAIEGVVDFRALVFLGNLGLIAVFALLWISAPRRSPWLLVPVAALIFDLDHWESAAWAMVAIQQYFMLALAVGSLASLSKPGAKHVALAAVLAVAAVYTQANGMLVFPAGACVLLPQRRSRALLAWGIVAAAAIVPYFIGYTAPGSQSTLATMLGDPLRALEFLAILLGAGAGNRVLSVALGLAFAIYAAVVVARADRSSPPQARCIGMIAFLALTCGSVALGRSAFGPEYAHVSRYRIYLYALYSVVILSHAGGIRRCGPPQRWSLAALVAACLAFHLGAREPGERHLLDRKSALLSGIATLGADESHLLYPDQRRAKEILADSARLRTYVLPRVRVLGAPGSGRQRVVIDER
jgi:hypothetical protein